MLICVARGSRHQRESRVARSLSLAMVAPFAIAALAGWLSVLFLLWHIVREAVLSWGFVVVLFVITVLCAVVTREVVATLRGLTAPREVMCLEK